MVLMPTPSPRQTGILVGITVVAAGVAAAAPLLARWLDRRASTPHRTSALEPLRTFSPAEFSRAIDEALGDPTGRRMVPLLSTGAFIAERLRDDADTTSDPELQLALDKLGSQPVTDAVNRALASDPSLFDAELARHFAGSDVPLRNDRVRQSLRLRA